MTGPSPFWRAEGAGNQTLSHARTAEGEDGGELRSYYGRPVIKAPVWKWEIPAYLFAGGLAGASASLSSVAGIAGNRTLARRALGAAAAAAAVSPVLLVADLGRPERFLHMLRVAKPSSPMSVGTWVLTAFAPAACGAAVCEALDVLPATRRALGWAAGCLGPVMATYTAVLVADTAVPVWHEARRELPFVFAGGAAASAGATAVLLTPGQAGRPAARLALLGAGLTLGAGMVMERRLGPLAGPYRQGTGGTLTRWSKGLTAVGAALTALTRRRGPAAAGAAMVLAGALVERFAVFTAGLESARDPAATVDPQRRRLDARGELATPPGR